MWCSHLSSSGIAKVSRHLCFGTSFFSCRLNTVTQICHKTRRTLSSRINMTESTKISSPVFRSVLTPELAKLAKMFEESNHELRIAGGAVRDILMNKKPDDIDFATTATPTEMKQLFEARQIRMINVGGEKHGTITARIDDRENFEITTLRIDKTTDGRWAEVEFTKDWVLDANRRDLTINSMFLDLEGNLFDYFDGCNDLLARRVRFVGDANARIREDYLRILRYFRFYARISPEPDMHDDATLEAISSNAEGLKRISGERIWTELRRIAVGPYASAILTRMITTGLTPHFGIREDPNIDEMEAVWNRCKNLNVKPMTILSALLHDEKDIEKLDERLKLSNEECGLALFIIKYRANRDLTDYCETHPDGDPLTPYQKLFAEEVLTTKMGDVMNWCIELLKYRGDQVLVERLQNWQMPKFPVTGGHLFEKGIEKGPKLGSVMNHLRKIWLESEFQKTSEELLETDLPIVIHNLSHQQAERSKQKKQKKSE